MAAAMNCGGKKVLLHHRPQDCAVPPHIITVTSCQGPAQHLWLATTVFQAAQYCYPNSPPANKTCQCLDMRPHCAGVSRRRPTLRGAPLLLRRHHPLERAAPLRLHHADTQRPECALPPSQHTTTPCHLPCICCKYKLANCSVSARGGRPYADSHNSLRLARRAPPAEQCSRQVPMGHAQA